MAVTFNPLTGNFDIIQKDLFTGSLAAANNQASPTNVTGLTASGKNSAIIELHAYLDATTDLYNKYTLDVIKVNSDYVIVQSQLGSNNLNINFTVTTGGQIQYTSDNYTGFSSLTFKWSTQFID